MTSPWIKGLLVVSLGINCMIAGALTYRYLWGRPSAPFFGGPPGRDAFLSVVPGQNLAAHEALRDTLHSERDRLRDARRTLVELLGTEIPDRAGISRQLDTIHAIQSETERMVVEQMLKDLEALPPEKRDEYLAVMQRGLLCRREPGMGMGRGRGGRPHYEKDFFRR